MDTVVERMDSIIEDDPSLPIDFDQTSHFSQFLNHAKRLERQDSIQSDATLSEEMTLQQNVEEKTGEKKRNYSTTEQPPERPLSRGGTMREQENIISELKKECFGLKMRIYYMEERLHDTFDGNTSDVLKTNIELKVTIEELKQELHDKSDLLSKASQAMQQISDEKEKEMDQLRKEYVEECLKGEKGFDKKLDKKNQEIRRLAQEVDELSRRLLEGENISKNEDKVDSSTNEKILTDSSRILEEKGREVKDLNKQLQDKNKDYILLQDQKRADEETLKLMIQELEQTISIKEGNIDMLRKDVQRLASSPERSNQHYKKLYEKLGGDLADKDDMIKNLKIDLTKKTNLAEGLRATLHEKEIEKQRIVGQLQDQIKKLDMLLKDKEEEVLENDESLRKLKHEKLQNHQERIQFELDSLKNKDSQIVEFDIKLKQQGFELEKLKMLVEEKDKDVVFFSNTKLKTEQEIEKCRATFTEQMDKLKYDAEQKDQTRLSKIEHLQEQCHQLQEQLDSQMEFKNKVITHLAGAISDKDIMIENLVDILSPSDDVFEDEDCGNKMDPVKELQNRLKEKDKYHQKCVEQHHSCLQLKEEELNRLKKARRDVENLLEKTESKYLAVDGQFKAMEMLGKDQKVMIEQLRCSLEKSVTKEQEIEHQSCDLLQEKCFEIVKLHNLLNASEKELKSIQLYVSGMVSQSNHGQNLSPERLLQQLENLLKDKNVQQELITNENASATSCMKQQLLSTLKEKEQIIMDLRKQLSVANNEKYECANNLSHQLVTTSQELKNLSSHVSQLKHSQEMKNSSYQQMLNSKDRAINNLVKSGQEKDRIITSVQKKLTQSVNMLKDTLERKEGQNLLQENRTLHQMLQNNKVEKDLSVEKERQELKNVLKELTEYSQSLEAEKANMESDRDLIKVSKEALQNQLEDAYTKINELQVVQLEEKNGFSEASLISELSELVEATSIEKNKYTLLIEKLDNNQHPDSRLKLLGHELSEVEHLRRNLQRQLLSVLKKKPASQIEAMDKLEEENKKLKIQLEDSTRWNNSLQDRLQLPNEQTANCIEDLKDQIKEINLENDSLKDDLRRCENEAKQLNKELNKMKEDYEQLVHEQDNEISTMTKTLTERQEGNELMKTQLNHANEELIECHKQLDLMKLETCENKKWIKELDEKNKEIANLKNQFSTYEEQLKNKEVLVIDMRKEKDNLLKKQKEVDQQFIELNINAERTMEEMTQAEKHIAMLESQLSNNIESMSDEKKLLKGDVKQLCNINGRLRDKLKDISKLYEQLKLEKEAESNNLYEELQKAKKLIEGLQDDIKNRKKTTSKLENEVYLLNERTKELDVLSEQYKSTQNLNNVLQQQIDDFVKAKEIRQKVVNPELNVLREKVKVLSEENTNVNMQLLKTEENLLEKEDVLHKKENEMQQLREDNEKELQHLKNEIQQSKNEHLDILTQLKNQIALQNKTSGSQAESLKLQVKSLRSQLVNAIIDHGQFLRLQDEIDNLKQRKEHLEHQLKELGESAGKIKHKLSLSQEENFAKEKHIGLLVTQIGQLEGQLESFSPMHTSSQHNITLSSDAFTQTCIELKHGPSDDNSLIAMHIQEMRELRKQLEETIRNNDSLRHQLEERLTQIEHDAKQLNDPGLRISIIRENDVMRSKLAEKDQIHKIMEVHIDELLEQKRNDKDTINELHLQIHELNNLTTNLNLEMQVYDRLVKQLGIDINKPISTPGLNKSKVSDNDLDKNLLLALLEEIRDLRQQLQKTIDVNNALRQKLEEELGRPVSLSPVPIVNTQPLSARRSLFSSVLHNLSPEKHYSSSKSLQDFVSPDETPTKDNDSCSTASMGESIKSNFADDCILSGRLDNFVLSKQVVKSAIELVTSMEKKLLSYNGKNNLPEQDANQIKQLLEEILRLLSTFAIQENLQDKLKEENKSLKNELRRFKNTLASKKQFIKSTLDMIENNVTWKENTEQAIANKLLRAKETIKATKGNLQVKTNRSKHETSGESDLLNTSATSIP